MRDVFAFLLASAVVLFLVGDLAGGEAAADWPQWRGPEGSGQASKSPPLASTWPAQGPRRLWQSEAIPSCEKGGYGSVVVSEGRAYLFTSSRKPETAAPRAIDDAVLKRLATGNGALPAATLEALRAIKDKPLDQDALGQWLADQKLPDAQQQAILRALPPANMQADDMLWCLDATDGRTVWKAVLPGKDHFYSDSCTPLIADGRCYFVGSADTVYCLDVKDGSVVWKAPCAKPDSSGSFVKVGTLVLGQVGALVALDAQTGQVVWKQPKINSLNNTPALWVKDGKTYLLCNNELSKSDSALSCVDPADGSILWQAPGGHASTPVVSADYVVVNGDVRTGLVAYRMSPQKAERLWGIPEITNASSPLIHQGHVYANRTRRLICVELETGKVKWDEKACDISSIASPLLADGKLYAYVGDDRNYAKAFMMIAADPEGFRLLGTTPMTAVRCSSPAIAAGRAYLRLKDGVGCFDLTGAMPASP